MYTLCLSIFIQLHHVFYENPLPGRHERLWSECWKMYFDSKSVIAPLWYVVSKRAGNLRIRFCYKNKIEQDYSLKNFIIAIAPGYNRTTNNSLSLYCSTAHVSQCTTSLKIVMLGCIVGIRYTTQQHKFSPPLYHYTKYTLLVSVSIHNLPKPWVGVQ